MKLRKIFNRVFVSVLVVVLLICLPSVSVKNDDNLERIYNAFLGSKSKYQGIIEVWNIDTFEGGSASKSSVLNAAAKEFQSQNKGLYIMIRNLTENECYNLIASGVYPDLFSCSYGVAEKLKDSVKAFSSVDTSGLDAGARQAGVINDETLGVAWCKGSYYLISTAAALQNAGVENVSEVKISDVCLNLGYVVKGKKSDKQVYSLAFGNSKYLMPQEALKTYNKEGVKLISDTSFNSEQISQTGYSAYCNFIAGNSTVLLGTQRDVFRMENRVKAGKASDVVYEQVLGYTDLIQFMMLGKNVQGDKLSYVEKFAEFLISENCQKKAKDAGLLPVVFVQDDENKGIMQNITPQNFSDYVAPKLFISVTEINKLQNFV